MKRFFFILLLTMASLDPALAQVKVEKGSADNFVLLRLLDSTGAYVASQAYTDVACSYRREGVASAVAITEAAGTLGTHTDGHWSEDTTLKHYELSVPDAAFVTAAEWVVVGCTDASGTDFEPAIKEIVLVSSTPDVNVYSVSGDTTAADNLELDYDGTGLARTNSTIGTATTIGATGLNAINAEADTALTDYDPPTQTEMGTAFTEIKGGGWASGTDTLEAIRNQGDSAWITATSVDLNADAVDGTSIANGAITEVEFGTGAITAAVLAADSIGASEIATDAIAANEIAAAGAAKIADITLRRTTANIEGSSDGDAVSCKSLYGAVATQTHRSVISAGSWYKYKEDDSTQLCVTDITTDSGADPITAVGSAP